MTVVAGRSWTTAELEKTLRRVDADVLLVRSRLLRRVIREDADLPLFGVVIPHRKSYVLDRERLLKCCSLEDLQVSSEAEVPARAVLLTCPASDTASHKGDLLIQYWRMLFHAGVHKALESDEARARLTPIAVRERIERIGNTNFEEIRHVLREEKFLIHPHDDRSVYVEFAALYLEMHFFAPEMLLHYFPSLCDAERIDGLLLRDVDFNALHEQTRPPEVTDVKPCVAAPSAGSEEVRHAAGDFLVGERHEPLTEEKCRRCLEGAKKASAEGNSVRAMLLRTRVALATDEAVTSLGIGAELDEFVDRLQRALGFSTAMRCRWRVRLLALLARATRGTFPVEARLLYDLQQTCLDAERMTYSDIVDFITGLGRRKYRRPLPLVGIVHQVRHLRSAEARARIARLPEQVRTDIIDLIAGETTQAEQRLGDAIRPVLCRALDQVGLQATNLPEQLARAKLVEELVDRIVERGFFNMADLRDAIARNRLKLPDLGGPGALIFGDALLRLNRCLADAVAGIYRPGEIYLRALQRGTSLFFGNVLGRILTLFLLLPFGGAFVALYGIHFILEEAGDFAHISMPEVMPSFGKRERPAAKTEAEPSEPGAAADLPPPVEPAEEDAGSREVDEGSTIEADAGDTAPEVRPHHHRLDRHDVEQIALRTGVCGVFFFALIHWPAFRRRVVATFRISGQIIWLVFVQWPGKVLRWPPLREIVDSPPILLFRKHALRPIVATLVAFDLALWLQADLEVCAWTGGITLLVSSLFFNSRLGRSIEERVLDRLSIWWQAIRLDLVPGLARWILAWFQALTSQVEQLLYAVDEWLRFRAGDSRAALVYKPALVLGWFLVAYVVRFMTNLVVEPQVNPIKHFPVVTVSHKFVFPFALLAHKQIERALVGGTPDHPHPHLANSSTPFAVIFRRLSPTTIGGAVGLAIQFIVPGICGYLAWELRSNWRLYRKNQSPTLDAESIGHHGETMLRFIRPGLHSGTVPKLHARIRKALRRGRWRRLNKRQADLHAVEVAIRHFVQREFIALLKGSQVWGGRPLEVGSIRLGSNNIQIEIRLSAAQHSSLQIGFEQRAGWLVAGIIEPGWLNELDGDRRVTFANALAGFYKLCGVDLVREQVDEVFDRSCRWTADTQGLLVFPIGNNDAHAVYPLNKTGMLTPLVTGKTTFAFPEVPSERLLFSAVPITWEKWVSTWNRDQAGQKSLPVIDAALLGT